jgi:hypothetical protein
VLGDADDDDAVVHADDSAFTDYANTLPNIGDVQRLGDPIILQPLQQDYPIY